MIFDVLHSPIFPSIVGHTCSAAMMRLVPRKQTRQREMEGLTRASPLLGCGWSNMQDSHDASAS